MFKKHRNYLGTFLRYSPILFFLLFSFSAAQMLTQTPWKIAAPAPYVFAVACVLVMIFEIAFRNRFHSAIIPKYRVDAPSFWERNWEKLLFAIIGFILGWLSRFLPRPK
jgi:hypothetical protein